MLLATIMLHKKALFDTEFGKDLIKKMDKDLGVTFTFPKLITELAKRLQIVQSTVLQI